MATKQRASGNKKILLVCANPKGTNPLRTAEEERTLRECIKLSKHRDHLVVNSLQAATIDDLRRELLNEQYDIVHFSGHGTDTGLVFEDAVGRLMIPDSEALAEHLQLRGVSTALLNACYSLHVGSFTSMALDCTIAMEGAIADLAAIEFTRGFYDGIGAGLSVPEAYEEGLSCVRLKKQRLDAILLRKGEAHTGGDRLDEDGAIPPGVSTERVLLGLALDTSGSMQESLRNESKEATSRLQGARDSVRKFARSIQDELQSRPKQEGGPASEPLRAFAYVFGIRSGDIADLVSVLRAAQETDVESFVQRRKEHYEHEARNRYSGYSGLGALARSYGFGHLVNQAEAAIRSGAETQIKDRIGAEVAHMLLEKALKVGDGTVSVSELADLLDSKNKATKFEDLEALVYGSTPMVAALKAVRDRFKRMSRDVEMQGERVVLLLSDGEPTDGDPLPVAQELRESGITVVSCYVTSDDIADPRVLHSQRQLGWREGACLMFEAASTIDSKGPFARYLLGKGWHLDRDAKLFVQINHSDVLDEFIRVVGSPISRLAGSSLPQGR